MYFSTIALRFFRDNSGNRGRGGSEGVREVGVLQIVKISVPILCDTLRTSFYPMVTPSLLYDVVRGAKGG